MSTTEKAPSIVPPRREVLSAKKAKESLEDLQKEVELVRASEVLEKNNFELELETRIDAMNLTPEMPHRREIYERMMFEQKSAAKIILTVELAKMLRENSGATDAELSSKAKAVVESWMTKLATLDGNRDGKLNYEEIIPQSPAAREFVEHVFGGVPFFVAMENNPLFQNPDPDVEKNVPQKLEFVKSYITNFAETLIDPKTGAPAKGAGHTFGRLLRSIGLSVVGGKFLKNEDFAKMWSELAQNEKIKSVFDEGEKQNEQEKFEKLLAKTSEQIRVLRIDEDKRMIRALQMEKSNPHGFTLRKWGDLTSIIYYYGSNILLATIGINLALSGFSPEKVIKNPVIWAMGAGILGAKKHFDPDFLSGTSPIRKAEQKELKERFAKTVKSHPVVGEWAQLFSKNDLSTEPGILRERQPLGILLAEKGRSEITSAELAPLLGKNVTKPDSEIRTGSPEAHELFLFFRACKQRDISPKKLLDA